MKVLGIESSCDETAAAVVADGRVCSDVVASQVAVVVALFVLRSILKARRKRG